MIVLKNVCIVKLLKRLLITGAEIRIRTDPVFRYCLAECQTHPFVPVKMSVESTALLISSSHHTNRDKTGCLKKMTIAAPLSKGESITVLKNLSRNGVTMTRSDPVLPTVS